MIALDLQRQATRADLAWAALRRNVPTVDRHDLVSLSMLPADVLREALVAAGVNVPFVDVYSADPARREPLPQVLLAAALMLVLGALEANFTKPTFEPVHPSNFSEPLREEIEQEIAATPRPAPPSSTLK